MITCVNLHRCRMEKVDRVLPKKPTEHLLIFAAIVLDPAKKNGHTFVIGSKSCATVQNEQSLKFFWERSYRSSTRLVERAEANNLFLLWLTKKKKKNLILLKIWMN